MTFNAGGVIDPAPPKRKQRVVQDSIGRVGPLRPAPAHPFHSLRDGLMFRLRGGIGDGGIREREREGERRLRGLGLG